jgi:predicted nucleic acid-binding protein
MKRTQLYLETSVWSFYYADDAPDKRDVPGEFFKRLKTSTLYEPFISRIVVEELNNASEEKRSKLLALLPEYKPKDLRIVEDVRRLPRKYLAQGIIPENKIEDAVHASVATFYEMDALVSWKMKHLANLKQMEAINGVNLLEGFSKQLFLITPYEVAYGEV